MRFNFSFSVTDESLAEAIKAFRARGGNLSALINNLLQNYFFGGNSGDIITKEMLLLLEIKKKLEEFEKWKNEITPKIKELEERVWEKQEQQQNQDEHIKLLRELFNDLLEHGTMLNNLLISKRYEELGDKVESRLTVFAAENQLSLPQAKELFYLAFPELRGKIKL